MRSDCYFPSASGLPSLSGLGHEHLQIAESTNRDGRSAFLPVPGRAPGMSRQNCMRSDSCLGISSDHFESCRLWGPPSLLVTCTRYVHPNSKVEKITDLSRSAQQQRSHTLAGNPWSGAPDPPVPFRTCMRRTDLLVARLARGRLQIPTPEAASEGDLLETATPRSS